MKQNNFFYVITIVILFVCASQTLQAATKRTVEFEFGVTIDSDTAISNFDILFALPNDIDHVQSIKSITFSKEPVRIFYQDGNKYAQFLIVKPLRSDKIIMFVTADIFTSDFSSGVDRRTTDSLDKYLIEEKFIEKTDESIKSIASTLNTGNRLQTIKNIYNYIYTNVTWNEYNPDDIGAKEVLARKAGDCTEFADLFTALCRANAIPARFVEGYTILNSELPSHDWAEVYTNEYGWITADATRSSFDALSNEYIQFTNIRNNTLFNNGHFWLYTYSRNTNAYPHVKVENHFTATKIGDLQAVSNFEKSRSAIGTYRITDVAWGQNMWNIALSASQASQGQEWRTGYTFPENEIKTLWDKGFFITDLSFGDGLWSLVMTKETGYISQEWRTRSYFPEAEIASLWDQGYYITNLSYGGGMWALVMSKGAGYTKQVWHTRSYFPESEIAQLWSQGYAITHLTFANGLWVLIMSETAQNIYQHWRTRAYFPDDEIASLKRQGFFITGMAFGDGLWAVVFSMGTNFTSQTWRAETFFPEKSIAEFYAK
jgi:hypothetical protein